MGNPAIAGMGAGTGSQSPALMQLLAKLRQQQPPGAAPGTPVPGAQQPGVPPAPITPTPGAPPPGPPGPLMPKQMMTGPAAQMGTGSQIQTAVQRALTTLANMKNKPMAMRRTPTMQPGQPDPYKGMQ